MQIINCSLHLVFTTLKITCSNYYIPHKFILRFQLSSRSSWSCSALDNILLFMNFYNISQIPERHQTAQHFHSSLEQPSLDNVQAQLFVARQRNYELSMQYFQNKYGNSELYNKFVEANSLEGLGAPQQPVYDFKRQLNRKALQIQEEEMNKIKNKQTRQSPKAGEYESNKYKRHGGRKNIWQKEEPDSVLEHSKEQSNPQPYLINVQEENQNVFMSEFKNYLTNKKKAKQDSKLQLNQTGNSQFKESNLSQSPSKIKPESSQKCYEEELVKKMFREITGKTDKSSRVEKVELIEYLNSNKKILKVLGITPEEVSTTIMSLQCKDHNLVNVNQGLMWVYACLGKADVVKKLKAQQQFEAVPQGCMLSKQIMQLFEDTFRAIDRHNDLIIKRVPYISRLTSQPIIKKNLNLPAVFEPQYNRYVSLRRIFQRIQIETLLCSEEQKKVNEYISWNQFIAYFQSGHTQRAKYDLIILVESLRNQQKFGFSHLPESASEIIASSFKRLDRGEEMFNTVELINQIKLHKEYQIEKYTFIKHGGDEGEGNSETFQDILTRIKQHGLKFVNPKEFLQYFSDRGKPIEEFEVQRKARQSKTFSPSKVSFVQNQMFPKAEEGPDGYDSDPELYNNSKLLQGAAEGRKSQKQFKRFKETGQSFIEPDRAHLELQHFGGDYLKITVPKPFSFEQREKERLMNRSRQQQLEMVTEQSKFKAGPIPPKVKEVGLFEKIMTEQQKKNEDRKKSSMIMTLANERPFSFENRKVQKKTKEQRQEFIFQAKPIPWFCSVDLLNRKKQEEIVRKERIAKTAQEKLTRAKLPPRMQKDFLQKEAKKAMSPNSKVRKTQSMVKVKDPPDFNKIHKQFEQAMQRKRKENKPTEIKQFKFASTVKDNISKLKVQEHEFQQIKKPKYEPPASKSNVDIFAQSTAKFTHQVQKRRKELEEKRKLAEKKKKEEEQRTRVDEQLKRKVQEAARKNKENNEKELQQKVKEENARQMADYKSRKQEIIDKARKQPMLMERVSKRDEKIQKMKKLWEISQTLLKNGIRGKDHDHYFKREELIFIEDYKQLKDKL